MATSTSSFGDHMLRAHAALHEDLQAIKQALGTPAEARRQLFALRAHVLDHFRQEEQGGYMALVLVRQPQQERTVQRLLAEHHRLAVALEELVREAAEAAVIDDGFRARVWAWAKDLRRHEADENVLVEEAFLRDVGAKD
jgi:hypothetical protein